MSEDGWQASPDEAATEALGRRLGEALMPDGVALLSGELGVGKTVLVRGLAAALGIDREAVRSPTYTLIDQHRGRDGLLVHVDLYRLAPEEADALGLDELLAGEGVKAIEWPDRLSAPVPGAVHVTLRRRPGGGREIRVEGSS